MSYRPASPFGETCLASEQWLMGEYPAVHSPSVAVTDIEMSAPEQPVAAGVHPVPVGECTAALAHLAFVQNSAPEERH